MCSGSSIVARVLALVLALGACALADGAPREPLRVCADPNNLPFSNEAGRGFENALAELLGKELRRPVEYTWKPQRRGFIRTTLKARLCDVVIGVPAGYELVATTRPYYRSSYVFVSRPGLELASLDDKRLRELRIGIHALGDDYANVPPAHALARRGLADRIVGYSIYGDYSRADPPADLIRAVERGEVDVAIAWGPLAGYFARQAKPRLRVTPVASDDPGMTFAIAMGVRRGDDALRATLDRVIVRRRAAIARLLARFAVPQLPLQETER